MEKVKVHFLAVGSAPIMKKTKFLVDGAGQFMTVSVFLRKQLKLKAGDPLVSLRKPLACT
jgi:ubiquitin-like protein ATG12